MLRAAGHGFCGLLRVYTQGARTVTNIERMFKKLAKDYPNLDPAKFVSELGDLLGGLTANTQDLTSECHRKRAAQMKYLCVCALCAVAR